MIGIAEKQEILISALVNVSTIILTGFVTFLISFIIYKIQKKDKKKIDYIMMNKSNIKQLEKSLEEYEDILHYTYLLNRFYLDERVNKGVDIYRNINISIDYLNKLKKDFYYDKEITKILNYKIKSLKEIKKENTEKFYDNDDSKPIYYISSDNLKKDLFFYSIDYELSKCRGLINSFVSNENININVYVEFIKYLFSYYSIFPEYNDKNKKVGLDFEYDYEIFKFLLYLQNVKFSTFENIGIFQIEFDFLTPYSFEEDEDKLKVEFKEGVLSKKQQEKYNNTGIINIGDDRFFNIEVENIKGDNIVKSLELHFNPRDKEDIKKKLLESDFFKNNVNKIVDRSIANTIHYI